MVLPIEYNNKRTDLRKYRCNWTLVTLVNQVTLLTHVTQVIHVTQVSIVILITQVTVVTHLVSF